MKQLYKMKFFFALLAGVLLTQGSHAQGDNCGAAIPLTVNINQCTFTQVTNAGLTDSGQTPVGANCDDYAGGDLWMSVVLPPSGQVTISVQFIIGVTPAAMDVNMAGYSGSCGALSLVACDDDSGLGVFPSLTLTGTPGETRYIQLWETNNNTTGAFNICANGLPECTSPTATFSRVCAGNNQFEVNVNVTSLGDASTVNITNNGAAPAINGVSSTGIQTVGPFNLGQVVNITVTHGEDSNCKVTSPNLSDVGLGCEFVLACGSDVNRTYCYRNNDTNPFLYSSPDGSPVTLTFNSGMIEAANDIITIRNGNNASAPILFTGANGGNLSGITETASSGSIYLQVTSNATISCSSGGAGLTGGWNWTVSCEGCVAPQAGFAVLEDCDAGTFTVNVNITSLGNATSVDITNDAGVSSTTGVNATGVQNVGPFILGTPVEITVSDAATPACNVSQGGLDFECSAPSPACEDATQLTVLPTFAQSMIPADLNGVGFSGDAQCIGGGSSSDLYFKFTAVTTVTYFRVNASGDFNPAVEVFSSCGGAQLACVNDQPAGVKEVFWVDGTIPGEEYVYRVYHAGAGVPATTSFNTGVAHIPFVKVRDADCGISGLINTDIIRSDQPNPTFLLSAFIWEFTELEAPFDVYEVVSPNGANPQFKMFWFPQVEYGRSYSVRVKTQQYQGPNIGDYGAACTITMAAAPATALRPDYENGFYDLCDILRAVGLPGTVNYHWTFDDGTNVYTYDSNSSSDNAPLKYVEGLELGTSYTVNVFATDANGVTSTTSIDRQINMNNFVPNTGINTNLFTCGSTVELFDVVQAVEVCASEGYTFRFANLTQPGEAVIEHFRPNRVLKFSFVPGLIEGDTYNVSVRASSGGLTGDYSAVCQVTIAEPEGLVGSNPEFVTMTNLSSSINLDVPNVELGVYPNPSTGTEVMVNVSGLSMEAEDVQIEIYDLTGKRLIHERMGNKSETFNAAVNLRGQLANGVYILRLNVNGEFVASEKLIVH